MGERRSPAVFAETEQYKIMPLNSIGECPALARVLSKEECFGAVARYRGITKKDTKKTSLYPYGCLRNDEEDANKQRKPVGISWNDETTILGRGASNQLLGSAVC